jgi:alpha-L-rhamnosidase
MQKIKNKIAVLIVSLGLGLGYGSATPIINNVEVNHLLVESLEKPLGIDNPKPNLSWQIESSRRGVVQKSYQIFVASSLANLAKNMGDYWNSGKVISNKQNYIKYRGKELKPGTRLYWKVRIYDDKDQESKWSSPSTWVTGLLTSACKGQWISYDPAKAASMPLFKKVVEIKKPIKHAIIHITGLGYYELFMNGKKVGDHVLDPGQTNYDDYALYVTYDVADFLKNGNNVMGVMLGDGWYNQNKVWGRSMSYGIPRLMCQLDVTFADGSMEQFISDTSWKWHDGPVVKSNVYEGEVYDARKEVKNWSSETEMSSWMPVVLSVKNPPGIRSQTFPAIKVQQQIPTSRFYKVGDGKYLFDVGENFAGWAKLKVKAHAGDSIKLRMGEEVEQDGNLDMRSTGVNATKVEQTNIYICKSDEEETWEPKFTYHGFRYIEVSGLTHEPSKDMITGIVVNTAVNKAGNFESSEPHINRLHQMAIRTMLSNLHSIPTDCPTREKCGWLGDAHALGETSIYNFDMERFWINYQSNMRSSGRDTQTTIFHVLKNHEFRKGLKPAGIPYMISPGKRHAGVASIDWGTAVIQLPWYIYLYYGNQNILEEFYPNIKQWVDYATTLAKDHIVYEGLGDWCPPGGQKPDDCPVPLSSTAFYYLDLNLMSKIAGVLGNRNDQKHYSLLSDSVKQAFIKKFYDADQQSFGTQTANAIALDFKLIPAKAEEKISSAIVDLSNKKYDGFMRTGIFGFSRIFGALSNYGNDKTAYQILTKKGNNSFELMWKKYNATTLWEALPVDDKYKNNPVISHNHPMQAGFDAWFYEGILGIKPMEEAPGFKSVKLSPALTQQLAWAKGSYESAYGKIISDWERSDNLFKWKVTIPANTTAIIYIPAISLDNIQENGQPVSLSKGIEFLKMEDGKAVLKIVSGDYYFISKG